MVITKGRSHVVVSTNHMLVSTNHMLVSTNHMLVSAQGRAAMGGIPLTPTPLLPSPSKHYPASTAIADPLRHPQSASGVSTHNKALVQNTAHNDLCTPPTTGLRTPCLGDPLYGTFEIRPYFSVAAIYGNTIHHFGQDVHLILLKVTFVYANMLLCVYASR